MIAQQQKQQHINTAIMLGVGVVGLALMLAPEQSLAGVGGSEFDDIWTTMKDWIQGTLGRIISGSMILVGIFMGIARQNLMAFAIGIGGGIGLYNTPEVIEQMMGATLSSVSEAAPLVHQLSNGFGG